MTYETSIMVLNTGLYIISGALVVLSVHSFVKKNYLDGLQNLCWAGISFCFASM